MRRAGGEKNRPSTEADSLCKEGEKDVIVMFYTCKIRANQGILGEIM